MSHYLYVMKIYSFLCMVLSSSFLSTYIHYCRKNRYIFTRWNISASNVLYTKRIYRWNIEHTQKYVFAQYLSQFMICCTLKDTISLKSSNLTPLLIYWSVDRSVSWLVSGSVVKLHFHAPFGALILYGLVNVS